MPFKFIPGSTIQIPEINYKDVITISPINLAVIIIDMQNDLVKEGGSLEHYLSHVWHIENLIITGTVSNICIVYRNSRILVLFQQRLTTGFIPGIVNKK